ncbi:hypothetical protein AAVH_13559 [Aphelenchoides avenae]|nr:hypothetical protein AAVH_13559 [Aphelenchus avenae]
MAALFNANTVKRFNYLVLTEMPPCDAELIADWLHYGNGQPRNMQIWWDCTGENELDALKLVNILKERFLGATSPQTYEFYAGAERFESYDVRNARLENACGEVLKVESTQTCYSDVRVTRFPK